MRRVLVLFAVAVLFLIIPFAVSTTLQGTARHFAAPATRPLHSISNSLRNTLANVRNLPNLTKDRSNLQNQVVALEQQLLSLETVQQENQDLRKELAVTGVVAQKQKVLAHILTESSDPTDRLLSIDVGTQQSIKVGQPVTVQGALVGIVLGVSRNSAIIRPVTSTRSAVQISVADQNGLLAGDGDSAFISDIPQGVPFVMNTPVQTSGLGGSLPAGIFVGTQQDLTSKPSDVTQRFRIDLPYSGRPLSTVMVLIGQ